MRGYKRHQHGSEGESALLFKMGRFSAGKRKKKNLKVHLIIPSATFHGFGHRVLSSAGSYSAKDKII